MNSACQILNQRRLRAKRQEAAIFWQARRDSKGETFFKIMDPAARQSFQFYRRRDIRSNDLSS
jgi:hypothetical protein